MLELRMHAPSRSRPEQLQTIGYAPELNERYGGGERGVAAIGCNRLLPLPLQKERLRHARDQGRIEAAGALVGRDRRVKETAVPARLNEPREQLRLRRCCAHALEQSGYGFAGMPRINLHVCVQVVRK